MIEMFRISFTLGGMMMLPLLRKKFDLGERIVRMGRSLDELDAIDLEDAAIPAARQKIHVAHIKRVPE